MTNRIDHSGHNHPATPAARAACRKSRPVQTFTSRTRDEAIAVYWSMPLFERTQYDFEHMISELMIGRS